MKETKTVQELRDLITVAEHSMCLLWTNGSQSMAFEVKSELEKLERRLSLLEEGR